MRVLHLSWEYPPLVYGGLGRHVHALAEAQAGLGHDVTVVTQHADGAAPDEVVAGVRVLRMPADPPRLDPFGDGGLPDLMAWVLSLNHALARGGLRAGRVAPPDVVHAHDWVTAHAGADLKEAYAVPLVATVHATEAGRHQGWLPGPVSEQIHTVEWWLTFEARRVVVCSEHMRWEVTRLFDLPPDKVDVVPNGIDLRGWQVDRRRAARARGRWGGPGPLVVFSGRLEWEKGGQTVVEALPRLRRRFPGLRVVFAGDGSQRAAWERLARERRVAPAVTFAGLLPTAELAALVAAADVAVVPSVYEPFGLVALEAAALGTPLAVAETGGLAEFVEPGATGLRFAAQDAAGLADAVTTLLHDQVLARRLVRAARRRLVQGHDWRDLAARTVEVYQRAVVEERARATPVEPLARPDAPGIPDGNLLR